MMQAVFMLRARRYAKLDLHEELYPYWAEQAYMLSNSVFNQVENERAESDDPDGSNSSQFALKGKGDSGAFSEIYQYMQEHRQTLRK